MSEQTATKSAYSDLIREAYIDPIRTVTVREHSQKVGQTTLAALSEKTCSLKVFHRPAL